MSVEAHASRTKQRLEILGTRRDLLQQREGGRFCAYKSPKKEMYERITLNPMALSSISTTSQGVEAVRSRRHGVEPRCGACVVLVSWPVLTTQEPRLLADGQFMCVTGNIFILLRSETILVLVLL